MSFPPWLKDVERAEGKTPRRNGKKPERIPSARELQREWQEELVAWSLVRRQPVKPADALALASVDKRIHGVIRASATRHGWEGVEDETPLDQLLARHAPRQRHTPEELTRQQHFHVFLGWMFGDGPHPAKVMRRLYALAFHQDPELIAYMTMADLGLVLGETRAAFSWRLGQLFPGIRCRAQKRAGSKSKYAAAQRGNRNRARGERRKRRAMEREKYHDN